MMKTFGGETSVRNKHCKIFNHLYIRCIEGEVGAEKFYEILFCSDVCVPRQGLLTGTDLAGWLPVPV